MSFDDHSECIKRLHKAKGVNIAKVTLAEVPAASVCTRAHDSECVRSTTPSGVHSVSTAPYAPRVSLCAGAQYRGSRMARPRYPSTALHVHAAAPLVRAPPCAPRVCTLSAGLRIDARVVLLLLPEPKSLALSPVLAVPAGESGAPRRQEVCAQMHAGSCPSSAASFAFELEDPDAPPPGCPCSSELRAQTLMNPLLLEADASHAYAPGVQQDEVADLVMYYFIQIFIPVLRLNRVADLQHSWPNLPPYVPMSDEERFEQEDRTDGFDNPLADVCGLPVPHNRPAISGSCTSCPFPGDDRHGHAALACALEGSMLNFGDGGQDGRARLFVVDAARLGDALQVQSPHRWKLTEAMLAAGLECDNSSVVLLERRAWLASVGNIELRQPGLGTVPRQEAQAGGRLTQMRVQHTGTNRDG
ncbi:hypothetical protein AURDEDRAFT_168914 [Auricularia subglabra TFB-10046 SS5]|nr:hypothetical protein AURDEDRAFT_168914 [Auricularia subglabra TFB-10046 SS5]